MRRLVHLLAVPVAASLAIATEAAANHIPGTSCGTSRACADHRYWPRMTRGDVKRAALYGRNRLRGRQHRVNELLGWHGSDTLIGGSRSDVLWADHVGTGQPPSQVDSVFGRGGTDFIYSARGTNTIYGGTGNDVIKIRYGHGLVDCGPGRDVINVPRSRQRRWTIRHCEKIDHLTEQRRGGSMKPLR